MLDGLPVTLSPFLLKNELHWTLCVLDDGGIYFDLGCRYRGTSAKCVIA